MLLSIIALQAHEFMHVEKRKRVSIHKIRQEFAEQFSEQLKYSAQAVELLGSIQMAVVGSKANLLERQAVGLLNDALGRLEACSSHYENLLAEIDSVVVTPKERDGDLLPFAHTIRLLGAVQRHIIDYLQDIFEERGGLFITEHKKRLQDVIKTVRMYTDDLKGLCNRLFEMQKSIPQSNGEQTNADVKEGLILAQNVKSDLST
jgi:hypothetical protein